MQPWDVTRPREVPTQFAIGYGAIRSRPTGLLFRTGIPRDAQGDGPKGQIVKIREYKDMKSFLVNGENYAP
jgi:hypothetical protein